VYTTWAKNYFWKELCNPKTFIYHSCDIFSAWESLEPKMLECADVVLCTSKYIYDVRSGSHNNVHLIRNGVDSNLLTNEYKIIEDVRKLDSFIVAFVGAVGEWVDTDLIEKVANKYTTVFLGKDFGKKCPDNVINLGCVDHSELVNYYNSVDAFLLPFDTDNEITLAACPIKLYEYMSTGKPIISTSWEETELFNKNEKVILTATNKRQFLSYVDFAFETSDNVAMKLINESNMKTVVKEHTWEKRFEQLQTIIG
jgi:glycosyltransferase involved in cell wall biosynthesis